MVATGVSSRWILACTIAETIGIGSAALGTRLINPDGSSALPLILAAASVAGIAEGSALGLLQGRVTNDYLPAISRVRWLLATFFVALAGWTLGSLPAAAAADEGSSPPLALIAALAVALGIAMGTVFGAAQWLVLRDHVVGSGKWVLANATGWAVAMPFIYVGASLPTASTTTPVVALIGAVAGACAGCALGVVTGRWLVHLSGTPPSTQSINGGVVPEFIGPAELTPLGGDRDRSFHNGFGGAQ